MIGASACYSNSGANLPELNHYEPNGAQSQRQPPYASHQLYITGGDYQGQGAAYAYGQHQFVEPTEGQLSYLSANGLQAGRHNYQHRHSYHHNSGLSYGQHELPSSGRQSGSQGALNSANLERGQQVVPAKHRGSGSGAQVTLAGLEGAQAGSVDGVAGCETSGQRNDCKFGPTRRRLD